MPGGGSEKTLMGARQEESSAESKESPPPEPRPLQQESFGEQWNWKAGLMAGPLCILVIWILIGRDDPKDWTEPQTLGSHTNSNVHAVPP